MLGATGLTDEDFARPFVGVANTWTEIGPCNFRMRELDVALRAEEMSARLASWRQPAPRYRTGVLARYSRSVSSAAVGAVLE